MSLASAVVLLQTALSLLTLVNSSPSLPQSMRDNAQQVAQQAIAQATTAIAAGKTNNVSSAQPAPSQTSVLPSGVVVDASGHAVSTAPSSTMQEAGLQVQSAIVQGAPQGLPSANTFYSQGSMNLRADLYNMDLGACVGNQLSTACQQSAGKVQSQANDTVKQAKYVILANTSDADINALGSLVRIEMSSIDKVKQAYEDERSCAGEPYSLSY